MTADVEQILRDSGQVFSNVAPVKRQKRPDGAIGKPFNSKLLAEAERALATVHDSHRIISLGQFSDQAAMALSGLFMIQFRKASNPTLNQDFSFRP